LKTKDGKENNIFDQFDINNPTYEPKSSTTWNNFLFALCRVKQPEAFSKDKLPPNPVEDW
jgi:hypothetical protein